VRYNWGGGITSANKVVSAPGNYVVTVTNSATGCTASTSTTVTQKIAVPNVSIATPAVLTCAVPGVTLTASSTTTGAAFNWGGGVSTATYLVSAPGAYSVTVTDPSNSCSASTSVSVSQNNTLPAVTLSGNPDTVCYNVSAFTLSGGTPPGGIYSGNGVTGTLFNPASGTGVHIITYSYTDQNNCSSSASETIIVRVCTTGIRERDKQSEINLYPNPAQNQLILQSELFYNKSPDILVLDINGKICDVPFTIRNSNVVLNTSSLAAGIYSLRCGAEEKIFIRRFVKVAW